MSELIEHAASICRGESYDDEAEAVERLLSAARKMVSEGVTAWGHDDHCCAVCDAYCPVADEDHDDDCAFIALKRAVGT